MALFTADYLFRKAQASSPYVTESCVRNFSVGSLVNARRSVISSQTFDIFLSHSSEDAILIKALRDELVEAGFSTYVDWIDDPNLDRAHVTKATAETLRQRMAQCRSLLFATSEAASNSLWMPWELGYMDALKDERVAIVPIVDVADNDQFSGQEYLSLYPYLDKTHSTLYVHSAPSLWVTLEQWLQGSDPVRH